MNRKTLTTYHDGKQTRLDYDSIGRMLSIETLAVDDSSVRTRRQYVYLHSGVSCEAAVAPGRNLLRFFSEHTSRSTYVCLEAASGRAARSFKG